MTPTQVNGRTVLLMDLGFRLHLMEIDMRVNGIILLNTVKGLRCTKMVMFTLEISGRVCRTVSENTSGPIRAILKEHLLMASNKGRASGLSQLFR